MPTHHAPAAARQAGPNEQVHLFEAAGGEMGDEQPTKEEPPLLLRLAHHARLLRRWGQVVRVGLPVLAVAVGAVVANAATASDLITTFKAASSSSLFIPIIINFFQLVALLMYLAMLVSGDRRAPVFFRTTIAFFPLMRLVRIATISGEELTPLTLVLADRTSIVALLVALIGGLIGYQPMSRLGSRLLLLWFLGVNSCQMGVLYIKTSLSVVITRVLPANIVFMVAGYVLARCRPKRLGLVCSSAAKDINELGETVTMMLGEAEARADKAALAAAAARAMEDEAMAELATRQQEHEHEVASLKQRLGAVETERRHQEQERSLFTQAVYNKFLHDRISGGARGGGRRSRGPSPLRSGGGEGGAPSGSAAASASA